MLNSISGLFALHNSSRPPTAMIKMYLQTMPTVPREGERVTPSWGPLLQGLEWRPEIWVLRDKIPLSEPLHHLGRARVRPGSQHIPDKIPTPPAPQTSMLTTIIFLNIMSYLHLPGPQKETLTTDQPTAPGSNPYLFWLSLSGSLSTKILTNNSEGRFNCDRFSLWYLW